MQSQFHWLLRPSRRCFPRRRRRRWSIRWEHWSPRRAGHDDGAVAPQSYRNIISSGNRDHMIQCGRETWSRQTTPGENRSFRAQSVARYSETKPPATTETMLVTAGAVLFHPRQQQCRPHAAQNSAVLMTKWRQHWWRWQECWSCFHCPRETMVPSVRTAKLTP